MLERSIEEQIVLKLIGAVRVGQPRIGGRKLYHLLREDLPSHQIKMGRDAFFDLMARYGLLLKRRRNKPKTTFSHHYYYTYTNLLIGQGPEKVHHIWVSDITYLKTQKGFLYLSLITDAYSKKIVGYQLADSLAGIHSVKALEMALRDHPQAPGPDLIHHSDRGIQYCAQDYIALLKKEQVRISMTQNSDPRENAIAERVNGTIKNELLAHLTLGHLEDAQMKVKKAIEIYNQKRPHLSCGYYTPEEVHQKKLKVQKVWKDKIYPNSTNPTAATTTNVKPIEDQKANVKPA